MMRSEPLNRDLGERTINGGLKRSQENERAFELSFSSEEPYTRFFGPEILDHADGAVNLTRLNELGIVLFNHNPDRPIGRIVDVSIEQSRGTASIVLDEDEFSAMIAGKIASGTLRGVSVGYVVNEWEDVRQGQTSSCGRFTGPCSIARVWTPHEISIVSVPADPTVGVGRAMNTQARDAFETRLRQHLYNKSIGGRV